MASRQESAESELTFNWDDKEAKKLWEAFGKFGNPSAVEITGKNFDKWLKDAGVFDKATTTTVTGIAFSKISGPKRRTLKYGETKKVVARVAEEKAKITKKTAQEELDDICMKMAALEGPSRGGATKASSSGIVNRLTDTAKYTGAHKERFDSTGKGKGIEGRKEQLDDSGYVAGYKNKDTFNKAQGEG